MADETNNGAETVEQKARSLGWKPKEEFRGDPERWQPADEFLATGERVLPILRSVNRRQEQELAATKQEVAALRQILETNNATIEELKQFNAQTALDGLRARKQRLLTEKVEAKQAGDVQKETTVDDQLAETNTAIKEAEAAAKPKSGAPSGNGNGGGQNQSGNPPNPATDPEFLAWKEENPWFGVDVEKTALASAAGNILRANPETAALKGKAFLDKVTETVNRYSGGNTARQRGDRVNGGGGNPGGGAGGGGNGQSYDDLPADAKAACARLGPRFIGPGKAYKDLNEWRKGYAQRYFSEAGQLWNTQS